MVVETCFPRAVARVLRDLTRARNVQEQVGQAADALVRTLIDASAAPQGASLIFRMHAHCVYT